MLRILVGLNGGMVRLLQKPRESESNRSDALQVRSASEPQQECLFSRKHLVLLLRNGTEMAAASGKSSTLWRVNLMNRARMLAGQSFT
jgi:hypothetical protein